MNLHHLLSQLSYDQLQRLADEMGVVTLSPSTRNLLYEIREKYKNDAFLAGLVVDLPPACRGFLQALLFLTDPSNGEMDIPEPLLLSWFGETTRSHLAPLMEKGLVFSGRDGVEVIIPTDLRDALARQVRPKPLVLPVNSSLPPPAPDPRNRLVESIFHLAQVLDRHKASLTQKGALHRKVYERFARRHQDAPSEMDFHLAVQVMTGLGLAVEQNQTLRLSPRIQDWLALPVPVMLDQAWRTILHTRVFPSPLLQQYLVLLISSLANRRAESPPPWFELLDWMEEFAHAPDPPVAVDSDLHALLLDFTHVMERTGILVTDSRWEPRRFTLGPMADLLFFSIPPAPLAPAVAERALLQSNFDLLVPPTASYADLWQIEEFADFVLRDVMTHYHVSQAGILRAMRRGANPDKLLAFLDRLTVDRIPQNVLYSIKEWCGKFGEIVLQRVALLSCRTPALADELLHIPEIAELLLERISDRHYSVQESDLRILARRLQERGYEPAFPLRIADCGLRIV